jgi:putative endonuclease
MDPIAKARGSEAERRAVAILRGLGYEILATNVRTKSGEIDVVARDGRILVIVEVRYRASDLFDAWRSLSFHKRRCLARAAREAARVLRVPRGTAMRFDVVLATADGALRHIRGALSTAGPYRA